MFKKAFVVGITVLGALGLNGQDLKLAPLFKENMVLQRNQKLPVWGNAQPGTDVVVTLADSTVKGKADVNGRWKVELPARKAGEGALAFAVTAGSEKVAFKNVVMGEVWICSGQSNMQMGYGGIPEIKEFAASAKNIRTFAVEQSISYSEEESCKGSWQAVAPPSAVACSFAYNLQKAINLPVGIILTCWGSSSIEGWMPQDMQNELPHFKKAIETDLGGKNKILCDDIVANYKQSGKLTYSKTPEITAALKGASKHTKNANIFARTRPNLLYNAMMHPLAPYSVRGLVWYQGEANGKSIQTMQQYGESLPLWTNRLRKQFNNESMHFMPVMLPGFGRVLNKVSGDALENPAGHSWAWIRESQLKILDLPNTSVATTIDLGDKKNIHPKDKAPIGERLALLARRDALGENIIADGPVYKSMQIKGNSIMLTFDNGTGLSTNDGNAPKAFWICGDDKEWKLAEAKIVGETIILTNTSVQSPTQVRYGFSAMPKVNLVNKAGLPARPFRTDSFQP